jgi:hypothetical protein
MLKMKINLLNIKAEDKGAKGNLAGSPGENGGG